MNLVSFGINNDNVPKEALNSKIFVGRKDNPVAIIKRCEIDDYVDDDFNGMYDLWSKFHNGFGLPYERSWSNHPKRIIDIIETFELEFKKITGAANGDH